MSPPFFGIANWSSDYCVVTGESRRKLPLNVEALNLRTSGFFQCSPAGFAATAPIIRDPVITEYLFGIGIAKRRIAPSATALPLRVAARLAQSPAIWSCGSNIVFEGYP